MNLRYIYLLFALLFLGYIFLGNSGGRAATEGWGNTGAPGDQDYPPTCIGCHHGYGWVDVTININNQDGSMLANNEYIPGKTYNMEVIIETVDSSYIPAAYGFQMIALTDSDNVEVNTWLNPGDNVQIANASNNGRTYVEHTAPSASNLFTMEWVAPEAGRGDVTFYSAGIGANGDETSSGDAGSFFGTDLTLKEGIVNSLEEFTSQVFQIQINPNPTTDYLLVKVEFKIKDDFVLNVLNANGQIVSSQKWSSQSTNSASVDVLDLPPGVYLLQVTNHLYSTTKKWVKL